MTFVVELREFKKSLNSLTQPGQFCPADAEAMCALRQRLAFVALLALTLGFSISGNVVPGSSRLATVCGVLTAAVSAALGLLRDASMGLAALFSDDTGPGFWLGQKLNRCFGEPVFSFDIYHEAGSFPTFSGHSAFALIMCTLFLSSCGSNPQPRGREEGASCDRNAI